MEDVRSGWADDGDGLEIVDDDDGLESVEDVGVWERGEQEGVMLETYGFTVND